MRQAMRNKWKRFCSVILAAAMVVTMLPTNAQAATSSSANADGTFNNPVIYADVPDIDIIRVENAYYMVSTTMHLSPGCPIMKSTDLVNWEIVNYVYDILGDTDAMNLRNGQSMYGNGQWASSLKYHDGTYYVAFNSNTTGEAYLYTTNDIERGAWTKTTLNGFFHDMSLFFDDDGKGYILYGGGQIKCAELSADYKSVKKETEKTLFDMGQEWSAEGTTTILAGEGTHIMKKDGYYYVFNISWPNGKPRTEVCHRSKTLSSGNWERKVILQANFNNNGVNAGVAQGAVIDTSDGKWYGFMFQDHGAIGRTPILTDCTWKDGWPMLGKNGDGKTVEATMQLPVVGSDGKSLVKSDEFYNDAEHRVFEAPTGSAAAKTYNDPAEGMELVDLIENGDFENGSDGWEGQDGGEIEVVSADNGTAKPSNHVLLVKNRTNSSSSAKYDFSGKIKKGTTYTITGRMKYDGENVDATKKFVARFQNCPAGAAQPWMHRPEVGTIDLNKGEWKAFTFTYTAADRVVNGTTYEFGTASNYFFIEGFDYANSTDAAAAAGTHLMDYYLDDISITYERPKGSGDEPGGDEPGIAGDTIELVTNGDVETGNETGWTTTLGEKACQLEAVNTEKADGEYSLHVSGRTTTGSGACQDLSGKMKVGKTYTISGKLKYTSGPDTKNFLVTIQHGKDYNYRQNLVTINAKKGEWVEFKGTYTAKDKSDDLTFDENNVHIFVETPYTQNPTQENDWMDYYLDDFSVTTPNENMAGDSTFNGGSGPWVPFESHGTMELVTPGRGGADDKCLKFSERTENWHGPGIVFKDKMTPGNTYTIKAYVKYDAAAPAEQDFYFTMKGEKAGVEGAKYETMATGKVKTGEWTEITGEWKMPEDSDLDWTLYLNTGSAAAPHMDFYLDDVTITEKVKEKPTDLPEAGEHDYNGSNLDLVWQWNHNPNNNNWSLTEREGWLRLKTGSKATSLLNARNTLTQRTFGPVCSGAIKMDISNMKNGDVAGLGSLSFKYGYIAVKKEASGAKLVMVDASGNHVDDDNNLIDDPVVKEEVNCTSNIVYLKEDFNYAGNANGSDKDTVTFYYSFDSKTWKKLGSAMKMEYELIHFMGSKFAIFNYATISSGGYVDVDYFRVSDKITGTQGSAVSNLKASMTATQEEVSGVVGSQCEVKLNLDDLAAGSHSSIKASLSIPNIMSVEDVVFSNAIKGEASYTFNNGRLVLNVTGNNVSFAATDKLFATIKLKVKKYLDNDTTVGVNTDYIMVDDGASEYDVEDCKVSIQMKYLNTKALAKKLGYGNPIVTQEFGADPYAIEYDGRVYVYMTADDYQYDENGEVKNNDFSYITSLRVVSSADLMNWTDHGEIEVAGKNGGKGPAMWASHSWAPAIAYKKVNGKDKFFLYFANDASGIGVLEADTPLGPWKDPIGKALLTKQTPGCQDVEWCFDPAVLVDDDGSAYIYFGGGVPGGQNPTPEQVNNPKTARVAKLGADMISIEGEAKLIDAPCMFEDSGIFKYNGKYYYSYCSNFISGHTAGNPGYGTICYMMSDNPMGPFTYAGEVFSNPSVWFGVGGNNHHATFVFENKSYFIYHAQTVSKELGVEKGYRSTHIDNIEMNSDGTIKPIKGTYAGIDQLHTMNPYERIDAETIAWNAGIKVTPCKETGKLFADYNTALTDLQDGDWTSVSQLDFGENGAKSIKVSAASKNGGKIEVRLDSPEGPLAGTVEVPATGSEETYKLTEASLKDVSGTRNVFLVFKGSEDANIMNVDYYEFVENEAKQTNGNKETLKNKIDEAKKLLESLSADEKAKLQTVINEVEATLNKSSVTDSEIQAALNKLIAAVDEAQKSGQAGKPAVNETFTSADGQTFVITSYSGGIKCVTVTGTDKQLSELTIPDTITYKGEVFMVTAIADLAFANQTNLKSVVIGENITSIGAKAFYNDASLTKITIKGADIKTIGKDAFKGINKKAAFVMAKNTFISKKMKYKITKCTASAKEIMVTGSTSKKLTTLKIPATVKYNGMTFKVTAVGKKAFQNQKKLKSVTIGKNVGSIGANAFSGDKSLAKIKFSGTAIKSIGKDAFKNIKKNATFSVKKSKRAALKKLLKKAKTKKFKVK